MAPVNRRDQRPHDGATNFAPWQSSFRRAAPRRPGRETRPYDMRMVDRFYDYCQAVARADRHHEEARARLRRALKRSIWAMLVAGSFLFYYVMDRAAQATALY